MWTVNARKVLQNSICRQGYYTNYETYAAGQLVNGILNQLYLSGYINFVTNTTYTEDGVVKSRLGVPMRTITGSYTDVAADDSPALDRSPRLTMIAPNSPASYYTGYRRTSIVLMFGSGGKAPAYEDEALQSLLTDIQIIRTETYMYVGGVQHLHTLNVGDLSVVDRPNLQPKLYVQPARCDISVTIYNPTQAAITLREMGIVFVGYNGDFILIGRERLPDTTIEPGEFAEVSFTVC